MSNRLKRTLIATLLAAMGTLAQAETVRSLQVTGQGEALGVPDRARLSMSVEARSKELKIAEDQVNAVVRAYLTEAKALGIKPEDLNTSGYTVNPEYDWIDNRQQFKGYHAQRQIEVTVRKLDQVGDYLLRATKVGVNQVNPPVLESSQAKNLEREALAAAARDAKAQAQVLAETLGVKLGMPRTISSSTQGVAPPPMPMVKMAMMRGADASGNEQMGFAAGQVRASANVTVDFELLP